jgi:hypothetical protein
MKIINTIILGTIAILLSLSMVSMASAVTISEISTLKIYPGEQASVSIEVSNNLNDDVEDVSLTLNLDNTGFISIGGNEESEDEIREDKEETFTFRLKAPSTIEPGAYNIPYTLVYTFQDEDIEKKGSFGVEVSAKTELDYSVETEGNVVGDKGKISLMIVNSGLGDIRFVSVSLANSKSGGYTLLSNPQVYVGTVDSDDFETATFDVRFDKKNVVLNAVVKYKDFENEDQIETITLPVNVYSVDEAFDLGIKKKNSTPIYLSTVVLLIILWFVYRSWRKRQRQKKSLNNKRRR